VSQPHRSFGRSPETSERRTRRAWWIFAGSFFILGHGGCFGDIGHCDIPTARDPFDLRPPHQLEPAVRILTVTDAVKALIERRVDAAKVTVNARTADRKAANVLAFDTVRLATYA
jgi:hypothetical protein